MNKRRDEFFVIIVFHKYKRVGVSEDRVKEERHSVKITVKQRTAFKE